MLSKLQNSPGPNFILGLSPATWFRKGVGQTVTGSRVSTWADQSGNGRDLLQATDANRPALQADGTVLFDGVSHFLKCAAFTLNQPETVYLLFKQVSWTINDAIYDGDTTVNTMRLFQSSTTPTIAQQSGLTASNANTNLSVGSYGVCAAVWNGASSLVQVNANAAVSGQNPGTTNAGGFTLGVRGDLAAGWSNIQVAEVIIFPAAHDAGQRSRVIQYLAGIGGVSL